MIRFRSTTPLKSVIKSFIADIEEKEANRNGSTCDYYDMEFQELKSTSEDLKNACKEGEKEENKKKNRYKDILPFDATRVVLSSPPGSCGDASRKDYINANFIKGASGSPAYIASQGPLPNTVNDFWRMIVQCEVQIIVMACNPHEAGKHKCEKYWVEHEDKTKTFGCVDVKLVEECWMCTDFLVRNMIITYSNAAGMKETRNVSQFHYLAWPDHGVPGLVRPLLQMVRLVRTSQASESVPVLVHCSAGCGRTGTICAIDFVSQLLRLGKLHRGFSLFKLVREMREQRVAMVQTKEQYVLLHQAVNELLKQQLLIIEDHPYENLDFDGNPIIKTFYNRLEFLNVSSELDEPSSQSCRTSHTPSPSLPEKIADEALKYVKPGAINAGGAILSYSKDNYQEKEDRINSDSAESLTLTPHLKKKKWHTQPSSKQEKEVVNITEKNRIAAGFIPLSFSEESPDSSLLRRPKIAKLRALFEKSTPRLEKNSHKTKNNSISRSHSLGPIRKAVSRDAKLDDEHIVNIEERKTRSTEPAIRSGGKLKVPKLTASARPIPQVKRSASLTLNKQPSILLSLFNQSADVDESSCAIETKDDKNQVKNRSKVLPSFSRKDTSWTQYEFHSVKDKESDRDRISAAKRHSLESATDGPHSSITLPNAVDKHEQRNAQIQQLQIGSKAKSGSSLKQIFSSASQRAAGWSLGVRERRNSFREAISHSDQFGTHGRYAYVPEDSASCVLVDESSKAYGKHAYLTVRTQNGDILGPDSPNNVHCRGRVPRRISEGRQASQSMRLPSSNKFLHRLRSELEEDLRHSGKETRSSLEKDVTDGPQNISKGMDVIAGQRPYDRTSNVSTSQFSRQRVSLHHHSSNPINHRVITRAGQAGRATKNSATSPQPVKAGKSSYENLINITTHQRHLDRISKPSSTSSQSAENLSDCMDRLPIPVMRNADSAVNSNSSAPFRLREHPWTPLVDGSESSASSSSGARELTSFWEPRFSALSRSKSTSNALEESRGKVDGSGTITTKVIHRFGANTSSIRNLAARHSSVDADILRIANRSDSDMVDKSEGRPIKAASGASQITALDVDVDAVAASMLMASVSPPTGFVNTIIGDNVSHIQNSSYQNSSRKQHYL